MSGMLSEIPAIERVLPKNRYIFHQGDAVLHIYEIISGEVQLIRRHKQGQKLILQRGRPGSILAEASLFVETYHCDAITAETTKLRCVPRKDVLLRFETDHGFARKWASHLAHEVRSARLKAEILSHRTVEQRLDIWLLQNTTLPTKGNWKELAAEIGTTVEALYRELARRKPIL